MSISVFRLNYTLMEGTKYLQCINNLPYCCFLSLCLIGYLKRLGLESPSIDVDLYLEIDYCSVWGYHRPLQRINNILDCCLSLCLIGLGYIFLLFSDYFTQLFNFYFWGFSSYVNIYITFLFGSKVLSYVKEQF